MYAACKLDDKCLIRAGAHCARHESAFSAPVHLCPYSEYPPPFYIHTAFNKSTKVLIIRRFDVQCIEIGCYFDYANFIRAMSSIYFCLTLSRWSYNTIIVVEFNVWYRFQNVLLRSSEKLYNVTGDINIFA